VILFIRQPLVQTFPSPHRQALAPLSTGAWPAWWRLAVSVLIGVWTHIAFDGLTRESAWQARVTPAIQTTVSAVEESGLKFYQVMWVLVSLLSLAVIGWVYGRFLLRSTGAVRLFDPADRSRVLRWSAILVAPYLVVVPFSFHVFEPGGFTIDKHAIYGSLQPYLLLVTVVVVSLGVLLRWRSRAP
jgi:hypothetical protein